MKYLFHALIFTLLISGAFGTSQVNAQPGAGEEQYEEGEREGGSRGVILKNPIVADDLQELFLMIIDVVLVFAVPLIVFFIIYAGFKYVTARGSASEIQKAHMALLYALIGGLLILGARILIEVVGGTVDVFKE